MSTVRGGQTTIQREQKSRNILKASLFPSTGLLLSFVLFIMFLSSCTVHAVDSQGEYEMLTLTGKLRLVGNEPFTSLVLTTDDGKDYLIEGDIEKELRSLQYQMVTVTGEKLPAKG